MAVRSDTITVKGMNCGHCAIKVEKALQSVSGVSAATAILEAGSATVEYDDATVSAEAIAEAVSGAGYEVVSV